MNTDNAIRTDIQNVLQQMRTMRTETQAVRPDVLRPAEISGELPPVQPGSETASFGSLLKDAVSSVNETQLEAGRQADAYVRGATDDLVGVMISSQKASVGFQAAVQVRNRMITAYQEIMNMPV